ncbi:MAG: NAD(P)H-dependent oxidoreductase subunit E, partial [Clostridia bacterium]|nr:NAD(P)H-dependent oxidoreductase subunit E [Clostridia bacterium]
DATRCIVCCGIAPVMSINGEVYGNLTVKDVAGIIEKYNQMD